MLRHIITPTAWYVTSKWKRGMLKGGILKRDMLKRDMLKHNLRLFQQIFIDIAEIRLRLVGATPILRIIAGSHEATKR